MDFNLKNLIANFQETHMKSEQGNCMQHMWNSFPIHIGVTLESAFFSLFCRDRQESKKFDLTALKVTMMAIRMPSHLTKYCHTLVKLERHKPNVLSHLVAIAFVYNVCVNDLYSHNKILRATNNKPGSTRTLTGFPCSVSILTLPKIH